MLKKLSCLFSRGADGARGRTSADTEHAGRDKESQSGSGIGSDVDADGFRSPTLVPLTPFFREVADGDVADGGDKSGVGGFTWWPSARDGPHHSSHNGNGNGSGSGSGSSSSPAAPTATAASAASGSGSPVLPTDASPLPSAGPVSQRGGLTGSAAADALASAEAASGGRAVTALDEDEGVMSFLDNVIAGKTDRLRKEMAEQRLATVVAAAASRRKSTGSSSTGGDEGNGEPDGDASGSAQHGGAENDEGGAAGRGSGTGRGSRRPLASSSGGGGGGSEERQQQQQPRYVSSAARSLQDYELVAYIGSGTFAEVTLARHRITRELFAIKKISKQKVKEEGCVERTFTERQLLASLHHPFLVRMYQAFQSRTHLYIVLDLAQGGDLYYFQQERLWVREVKRTLKKLRYPYYVSDNADAAWRRRRHATSNSSFGTAAAAAARGGAPTSLHSSSVPSHSPSHTRPPQGFSSVTSVYNAEASMWATSIGEGPVDMAANDIGDIAGSGHGMQSGQRASASKEGGSDGVNSPALAYEMHRNTEEPIGGIITSGSGRTDKKKKNDVHDGDRPASSKSPAPAASPGVHDAAAPPDKSVGQGDSSNSGGRGAGRLSVSGSLTTSSVTAKTSAAWQASEASPRTDDGVAFDSASGALLAPAPPHTHTGTSSSLFTLAEDQTEADDGSTTDNLTTAESLQIHQQDLLRRAQATGLMDASGNIVGGVAAALMLPHAMRHHIPQQQQPQRHQPQYYTTDAIDEFADAVEPTPETDVEGARRASASATPLAAAAGTVRDVWRSAATENERGGGMNEAAAPLCPRARTQGGVYEDDGGEVAHPGPPLPTSAFADVAAPKKTSSPLENSHLSSRRSSYTRKSHRPAAHQRSRTTAGSGAIPHSHRHLSIAEDDDDDGDEKDVNGDDDDERSRSHLQKTPPLSFRRGSTSVSGNPDSAARRPPAHRHVPHGTRSTRESSSSSWKASRDAAWSSPSRSARVGSPFVVSVAPPASPHATAPDTTAEVGQLQWSRCAAGDGAATMRKDSTEAVGDGLVPRPAKHRPHRQEHGSAEVREERPTSARSDEMASEAVLAATQTGAKESDGCGLPQHPHRHHYHHRHRHRRHHQHRGDTQQLREGDMADVVVEDGEAHRRDASPSSKEQRRQQRRHTPGTPPRPTQVVREDSGNAAASRSNAGESRRRRASLSDVLSDTGPPPPPVTKVSERGGGKAAGRKRGGTSGTTSPSPAAPDVKALSATADAAAGTCAAGGSTATLQRRLSSKVDVNADYVNSRMGDCPIPLPSLADDKSRFPIRLVAFYAVEMALVLQYLHGSGFIYRDLKPENVLMGRTGHIMLTDFGVAKFRKGAAIGVSSTQSKTTAAAAAAATAAAVDKKGETMAAPSDAGEAEERTTSFTGTPQYMSPEMLQGLPHDSRTDWWSYGCLLFEWANGRKAFDAPNQFTLFKSIVEEDVKLKDGDDFRLTGLELHNRVAQLHFRHQEFIREREMQAQRSFANSQATDVYINNNSFVENSSVNFSFGNRSFAFNTGSGAHPAPTSPQHSFDATRAASTDALGGPSPSTPPHHPPSAAAAAVALSNAMHHRHTGSGLLGSSVRGGGGTGAATPSGAATAAANFLINTSFATLAGTSNSTSFQCLLPDGGIAATLASTAAEAPLLPISCDNLTPAARDVFLAYATAQLEEANTLLQDLILQLLRRDMEKRLSGPAVLEHPFFSCRYIVSQLYYRHYMSARKVDNDSFALPARTDGAGGQVHGHEDDKVDDRGDAGHGRERGRPPRATAASRHELDDQQDAASLPQRGSHARRDVSGTEIDTNVALSPMARGGPGESSSAATFLSVPKSPGSEHVGHDKSEGNATSPRFSMLDVTPEVFVDSMPDLGRPEGWRDLFLSMKVRPLYVPRLRTFDDLRYFPSAVTATGLSAAVEQQKRIRAAKETKRERMRQAILDAAKVLEEESVQSTSASARLRTGLPACPPQRNLSFSHAPCSASTPDVEGATTKVTSTSLSTQSLDPTALHFMNLIHGFDEERPAAAAPRAASPPAMVSTPVSPMLVEMDRGANTPTTVSVSVSMPLSSAVAAPSSTPTPLAPSAPTVLPSMIATAVTAEGLEEEAPQPSLSSSSTDAAIRQQAVAALAAAAVAKVSRALESEITAGPDSGSCPALATVASRGSVSDGRDPLSPDVLPADGAGPTAPSAALRSATPGESATVTTEAAAPTHVDPLRGSARTTSGGDTSLTGGCSNSSSALPSFTYASGQGGKGAASASAETSSDGQRDRHRGATEESNVSHSPHRHTTTMSTSMFEDSGTTAATPSTASMPTPVAGRRHSDANAASTRTNDREDEEEEWQGSLRWSSQGRSHLQSLLTPLGKPLSHGFDDAAQVALTGESGPVGSAGSAAADTASTRVQRQQQQQQQRGVTFALPAPVITEASATAAASAATRSISVADEPLREDKAAELLARTAVLPQEFVAAALAAARVAEEEDEEEDDDVYSEDEGAAAAGADGAVDEDRFTTGGDRGDSGHENRGAGGDGLGDGLGNLAEGSATLNSQVGSVILGEAADSATTMKRSKRRSRPAAPVVSYYEHDALEEGEAVLSDSFAGGRRHSAPPEPATHPSLDASPDTPVGQGATLASTTGPSAVTRTNGVADPLSVSAAVVHDIPDDNKGMKKNDEAEENSSEPGSPASPLGGTARATATAAAEDFGPVETPQPPSPADEGSSAREGAEAEVAAARVDDGGGGSGDGPVEEQKKEEEEEEEGGAVAAGGEGSGYDEDDEDDARGASVKKDGHLTAWQRRDSHNTATDDHDCSSCTRMSSYSARSGSGCSGCSSCNACNDVDRDEDSTNSATAAAHRASRSRSHGHRRHRRASKHSSHRQSGSEMAEDTDRSQRSCIAADTAAHDEEVEEEEEEADSTSTSSSSSSSLVDEDSPLPASAMARLLHQSFSNMAPAATSSGGTSGEPLGTPTPQLSPFRADNTPVKGTGPSAPQQQQLAAAAVSAALMLDELQSMPSMNMTQGDFYPNLSTLAGVAYDVEDEQLSASHRQPGRTSRQRGSSARGPQRVGSAGAVPSSSANRGFARPPQPPLAPPPPQQQHQPASRLGYLFRAGSAGNTSQGGPAPPLPPLPAGDSMSWAARPNVLLAVPPGAAGVGGDGSGSGQNPSSNPHPFQRNYKSNPGWRSPDVTATSPNMDALPPPFPLPCRQSPFTTTDTRRRPTQAAVTGGGPVPLVVTGPLNPGGGGGHDSAASSWNSPDIASAAHESALRHRYLTAGAAGGAPHRLSLGHVHNSQHSSSGSGSLPPASSYSGRAAYGSGYGPGAASGHYPSPASGGGSPDFLGLTFDAGQIGAPHLWQSPNAPETDYFGSNNGSNSFGGGGGGTGGGQGYYRPEAGQQYLSPPSVCAPQQQQPYGHYGHPTGQQVGNETSYSNHNLSEDNPQSPTLLRQFSDQPFFSIGGDGDHFQNFSFASPHLLQAYYANQTPSLANSPPQSQWQPPPPPPYHHRGSSSTGSL